MTKYVYLLSFCWLIPDTDSSSLYGMSWAGKWILQSLGSTFPSFTRWCHDIKSLSSVLAIRESGLPWSQWIQLIENHPWEASMFAVLLVEHVVTQTDESLVIWANMLNVIDTNITLHGTSRRRTTNSSGVVVAVTPSRPLSIPIIAWLNNFIWSVFTTQYVQNLHQIERRGLLASMVTSRIFTHPVVKGPRARGTSPGT